MRTIAGLAILSAAFVGAGCAAAQAPSGAAPQDSTWRGVDLSYVNELEACGAKYRDDTGYQDPYAILARAGANVVRLRLWHSPDWTTYSTLDDVKQSIRRAKANNMKVLLDFHYSDDWVHPGKQIVPKAWAGQSDDELAASLGKYTKSVLRSLDQDGLLPDYVQIGNETNTDMLIDKEVPEAAPINWQRNVKFFIAGVTAVRTVEKQTGKTVRVMLHVAQPENIEPWLDAAAPAGLPDFDIIGLSYYEKWSSMPLAAIGPKIARLRAKYGKDVVIVETAYPWTLKWNDQMGNLLGEDSLSPGYEASPEGQRRYLMQLQHSVTANGGLGIVYWEPAWISSSCKNRWGTGSSWENAALFDFKGRLLPGAAFLKPEEGR
jgi:arabinogalactan endo-1,4-beta-galactosidase